MRPFITVIKGVCERERERERDRERTQRAEERNWSGKGFD